MAKTTRVVLVCDLHGDGTEAVTTIRMDNGTARYELDLCQSHLDEQVGGSDRGVEPVEPAQPRKPPVRRPRRRLGAAAAVPRTRRPCASGPAPMAIRSAVEVESRGTSWKPSPPANRRLQAPGSTGPRPGPPRSEPARRPRRPRSLRRTSGGHWFFYDQASGGNPLAFWDTSERVGRSEFRRPGRSRQPDCSAL